MEDAIRKRKSVRTTFTKTVNMLLEEFEKEMPNGEVVKTKFLTLDRIYCELKDCDDIILNSVETDEDFEREYIKIEEYRETLDLVKVKNENFVNKMCSDRTAETVISSPNEKRKIRLPKIELLHFGGDLKDYLGFWSQFQRIHTDVDLAPEDKFQYLLQCLVPGSRAREVIGSFPPTSENYEKAIEALKNRFGREELLIEFYVRELLSLVIQNATEKRGKSNISFLYDKLESHLRSLESIGLTSEKYEAILFPLVESCIPEELMRVWLRNSTQPSAERELTGVYGDKLKNLLCFLKREVEGEERLQLARNGMRFEFNNRNLKSKKTQNLYETVPTASNLFSADMTKRQFHCVFCDKSHDSKDCFIAQNWSLDKKKEAISIKKACYICFKGNHRARDCKSKIKCLICSKRHNTIMCFELPVNKREISTNETIDSSNALMAEECSETVLLQTILVNIEANGKQKCVRALIDSGSQNSHLLKKTAEELGLTPISKRSLALSLFGGVRTQVEDHGLYEIELKSPNGKYSFNIQVLDQLSICGKIPRLKRGLWNKELKERKIWIADYGEGSPEIELLIGADFCGQLFTGLIHKLECGLIAYETYLGWVLMGRPSDNIKSSSRSGAIESITMLTHSEKIEHFWDLELLGIKEPTEKTSREEEVMEFFNNTLSTDSDGRYMVRLPWTDNSSLPDNKNIAETRLLATTSKLISSGGYSDYNSVLESWEDENIIEIVLEGGREERCHYLPHRGVFKECSTTPLRPVFDAACKEKRNFSLNDCLEKGLNVLDTIPSILTRFREGEIGVISDIKKAFLQISIHPEDRDFLRFFWWKNYEKRKMKIYRHRRLVFGLSCSPFLLGAVINNLLENCPQEYRVSADILKTCFYVDNCVTSVDTEDELSEFVNGATELMKLGSFELRGWKNTSKDADSVPSHVLGLLWDQKEDLLFCDTSHIDPLFETISRRNVLSCIQKVFDPIGFTCPVTIVPKLLLQETWRKKLGWDEKLPVHAEKKFIQWLKELAHLSNVKIPRCVIPVEYRGNYSMHTFCDASLSSYACVIYLRSEGKVGVNIQLLQAKSRVAPLRKTTVPRLELLACSIGARLSSSTKESMTLEDVPRFFWTDSTTVLYWIKNKENWGAFVNNRVKEINKLSTAEEWRHVPGQCNPADLPSRGCTVKTLLDSRWWEGPPWLRLPARDWPSTEIKIDEEEVSKEKKKGVISVYISSSETVWYLNRFSKYSRIVRLVAWILRFCYNSRYPNSKRGELSVDEILIAEKKLLRLVQQESFDETVARNKLKGLNAFIDNEGLTRLKTKIVRRKDDENFRCPIVLPSNHLLVERLIFEIHTNSCHSGTQVVLSNLREHFWILRGRKTVQRVINQCIRCKRYTSKEIKTIPAPLPEDRVRDALVFEVTGVDLAGPLYLKNGNKAWILLFTCAIYRAVHLELIQSLSTDGFLLGLRRFVARRGRPRKIYSDNGTNFVGADNLMASLDWKRISQETSILRIQWSFNPPTASWWGGFWERLVQMVKKILKRILGRASINFEELNTILCDAEAVINSRPLNYLSEDPEDLTPLTPSMFIQDIQTVGVPDLDNIDNINLNKRLKYQQRLQNDLRKRFREEYLSLLFHQQIHKVDSKQVEVGDVVLVGCDNKKRLDWPMGLVVEIFPGKDNSVRVVKVKTRIGELIRPVKRLYSLELNSDSKIYNSELFKNVKDNNSKINNGKNLKDNANLEKVKETKKTEIVKTKCGRKVVKPKRYDN